MHCLHPREPTLQHKSVHSGTRSVGSLHAAKCTYNISFVASAQSSMTTTQGGYTSKSLGQLAQEHTVVGHNAVGSEDSPPRDRSRLPFDRPSDVVLAVHRRDRCGCRSAPGLAGQRESSVALPCHHAGELLPTTSVRMLSSLVRGSSPSTSSASLAPCITEAAAPIPIWTERVDGHSGLLAASRETGAKDPHLHSSIEDDSPHLHPADDQYDSPLSGHQTPSIALGKRLGSAIKSL